MTRKQLQRLGIRSILTALVLTAVFGLGSAAAVILSPETDASHDDHDEDTHGEEVDHEEEPGEHHDEEHEEDHVALTEQAYQNLDLRMGTISKGDYWKTLLVPGRVVEIPGQSNLSISASVTGIVEEVQVLPGQTLDSKRALFVLRITDEPLIEAQSKLLELLTRQEVAAQEIKRLQPLIDSGAVSGTKARDRQYELKQLEAQEGSLLQELRTRGMPQPAIKQLRDKRQLTTLTSVYLPNFNGSQTQTETQTDADEGFGYSVEELNVHPGMSVKRGDALCTVAYHPSLYVEGTAFQDDLPVLERILQEDWKVTVETHAHGHHHHSELSLDLLRIDNHVDEASQSIKFFLELPNEVSHSRENNGGRFLQWRFRPGQRLHIRLPDEKWESQVTLPADAVVIDGPNAFVFAEHHHEEDSEAADEVFAAESQDEHHDEHDIFVELEPIPVHLLHRDDKTVVIADDGQLHDEEKIALNNAYKLYLAMKMQISGGGGHHHHHDH
ncbi:MAG: efflux RND transporter periplasmic adaptor subunit [Aureliella sp.]